MATNKKSTDNNGQKKPGAPGVFDIARPSSGALTPSGTGRPIIVKHQLMPDPMVNDEPQEDLPVVLKPAKKVVITPLHDSVSVEPEAVEETAEEKPAEPAPAVKPADVSEPQFSPDTKIADVAPEPDTTAIPPDSKVREAETATARAKAAKLQKMIDEEEFFLPIETLEERRSRKVAIIGLLLIIILAVAWYDVALDAGLLSNSYNLPHSQFFTVKP